MWLIGLVLIVAVGVALSGYIIPILVVGLLAAVALFVGYYVLQWSVIGYLLGLEVVGVLYDQIKRPIVALHDAWYNRTHSEWDIHVREYRKKVPLH